MPHFVAEDGTRLHYRTMGSGPRPVLLIHGWAAGAPVWDELIAALDLSGLTLYVPDLRGAGESDESKSGYALGLLGADLLALADAAKLPRFSLVGHSMGGLLAQWVAAEAPARIETGVTVCTVPARGLAVPPEAVALFREAGGKRASFEAVLQLSCRQLPAGARERLLGLSLRQSPAAISQTFDAWSKADFEARLAAITAPWLVVATDDPFLGPELQQALVTRRIKGAKQVYLPGPGHYPQLEAAKQTAAVLQAFWAGALRA